MAVDPEYQLTFHREMVDVNLLVVCNALADHLDAMGPTVADVAEVFAASIPAGGTVVATPEPHLPTYQRTADERGATLLVADPAEVDEDLLRGFGHLVLAEHLALVLAVTRSLGIPDADALRGMREAPVDPYAMRITPIGDPETPAAFVNGFAANDPASTLAVWEHLEDRVPTTDGVTVIVNCRSDRVERTELFATDVLPHLPIDTLVVAGEGTRPILRAVDRGELEVGELLDLTGASADDVVGSLNGSVSGGGVVYGVGNLHGGGVELVAALEALAVDPPPAPEPAATDAGGSDPLERGVA
jgi:gamma-polyglutamate synthase